MICSLGDCKGQFAKRGTYPTGFKLKREMTTQKPALEIKTKQLQITAKSTTNILDKGDEESIERHLATLQ